MKNKYFLFVIFLSFSTVLLGQEGGSGSTVELPSFVITGEEKYDLPKAQKLDPQFIPIVSEDFLKPVFSPEFLETSLQSDPIKKQLRQQDSILGYANKLEASVGNFMMPSFNYSTLYPYKSITFFGNLNGFNQRPYETYSGRYKFHPEAGLRLKVVDEGAFFNDNEISIVSGYNFTAYKLYGLEKPTERKPGSFYMQGNLASSKSSFWQYNVRSVISSLQLPGENSTETEFILDLSTGFSGKTLEFSPSAFYSGSTTETGAVKNRLHFLRLSAPVQLNISDVLNISGGLEFTNCDSVTQLKPKASIAFKIQKGLMLFGSYNPGYETMHLSDALRMNNYFEAGKFSPAYYSVDDKITAGITFEFERFFDVMLSFSAFSSENYPAFVLDTLSRRYTLSLFKIKAFETSLDVRIYPSEKGYFYTSLKFHSVQSDSDKQLPFIPLLRGTFAYGYTLPHGINGKVGVNVEASRYEDIANEKSMDAYVSAFLELGYSFSQDFLISFKVNNFLNKDNFIWKHYKEIPFEASGGITFQW